MKERIGLKTHHIQDQVGSDPYEDFFPEYKIGTQEEREAFVEARQKAKQALAEGNVFDIGEENPDMVCDTCLHHSCPAGHSKAIRDGSADKRRALDHSPEFNNKYAAARLRYGLGAFEPQGRFHEELCSIIDDLWPKFR